uniref:Uncharacterized protein n=1 Tax=Romanomermis culicivorax TaxID=13658 RepID=A0A915HZ43_ROMCU
MGSLCAGPGLGTNLVLNNEMLPKILSIPLGPSVLLIKSPMAIAPTNDERRACSPFSCSASCFKI